MKNIVQLTLFSQYISRPPLTGYIMCMQTNLDKYACVWRERAHAIAEIIVPYCHPLLN